MDNLQHNNALPAEVMLGDDRYQIKGTLGEGGFGITYQALDEHLNRTVAIKECFYASCSRVAGQVRPPDDISREEWREFVKKFEREAGIVAGLDHPSILIIHDIFKGNGTAYIVTKYIEGVNLEQLMKERGKPLSEEEVVRYVTQIGEALSLLHSKGVLHRDIKPSNIMLSRQGNVILIDFGAAREFVQGEKIRHTKMGTPGFAPPELHLEMGITSLWDEWTPASDIYSLAATCYYLLTGKYYDDHKPANIKNITPTLWAALQRGLAKNPREREEDVAAFVAKLQQALKPAALSSPVETSIEDDVAGYQDTQEAVLEIDKPSLGIELAGIYMTSPIDGWIVGASGTILRYDQDQWVTATSPTGELLESVYMIGMEEGWAVGDEGTILHYRRGRWVGEDCPTDKDLNNIHMFSAATGLIAGVNGTLLHCQEGIWEKVNVSYDEEDFAEEPEGQLNAVHMASENEGWALGNEGYILHYHEGYWQTVNGPSTKNLYGIDMVSSEEGWIVGDRGTILHFNGHKWMKVTAPTSKNLYAINMISATDCWAVGENGIILHYDGDAWTKVDSMTNEDLVGVCMASPTEGWAISNVGGIFHYQNGKWEQHKR